MLEELPSADDLVAIRVSGRLERAEIERVLDRLEDALKAERVNLFVEVDGYRGFDVEGAAEHLRRVGRLLNALRRLDRVAIVSDQRWLRGLARLESALLPKVRYELFRSDERDRALAWVRGERALPRDPALRILETDRPDVLGFALDGKVSAPELAAFADLLEQKLEEGPVRVLGRIERFAGVDAAVLTDVDFIAMKRAAGERVERYAVVGGPGWMRRWVGAVGGWVKVDVRHFDDEDRAWAWLGASVMAERPVLDLRERRPPKSNGRGALQSRG